MALNSTQSNFEELRVDDNPKEVIDQFYDFFSNIPFIHNLTKADRKRAKDLAEAEKALAKEIEEQSKARGNSEMSLFDNGINVE